MLLIPMIPAGFEQPAPMPTQVHSDLGTAQKEAKKRGKFLVAFFPEDTTRRDAVLAFLRTVDGAKVRSESEVWLPIPGDVSAEDLLDRLQLRSKPALVCLDSKGRKLFRHRLGEDCVPLTNAFKEILSFKEPPIKIEKVEDWIGHKLDAAPFVAFAKARTLSLKAGAEEPHRTFLVKLLEDSPEKIQRWAATRLVEADAPIHPAEKAPFLLFLAQAERRYDRQVSLGNQTSEYEDLLADSPPHSSLGMSGKLSKEAPVWKTIRKQIRASRRPVLTRALYAVLAPNLEEKDRDWVLEQWTLAAHELEKTDPIRSIFHSMATCWLLSYGMEADWNAFMEASTPGWRTSLLSIRDELMSVPQAWNAPIQAQNLFCDDVTAESFWETPDNCLSQWGVTREALVELGIERIRIEKQPGAPRYPSQAKKLHYSGTVQVRLLVGADGNVKWARPAPGYPLALLGTTALAYASKWAFKPAMVAGVPRPSIFVLTMPFRLR